MTFSLLEKVHAPSDLRQLDESELPELSDQLRNFVVDSVSRTGGHLGASLGTIELTVRLTVTKF